MEPEPDRIDLAVLDPTRDAARFDAAVARIAQRGAENRAALLQLRRAVTRRGAVAFAVAMAAALVLWFAAPRPEREHAVDATRPARGVDILDWATRDVQPADVLELGGAHAQ